MAMEIALLYTKAREPSLRAIGGFKRCASHLITGSDVRLYSVYHDYTRNGTYCSLITIDALFHRDVKNANCLWVSKAKERWFLSPVQRIIMKSARPYYTGRFEQKYLICASSVSNTFTKRKRTATIARFHPILSCKTMSRNTLNDHTFQRKTNFPRYWHAIVTFWGGIITVPDTLIFSKVWWSTKKS